MSDAPPQQRPAPRRGRMDRIEAAVNAQWPVALAAWSAHTLLREPTVLRTASSIKLAGLSGQIASIRLADATIYINARAMLKRDLDGCELALLAHEIGHHIYAPGNLAEHARLFVVLRQRLTGLPERWVPLTANLWTDLLINDRLQHGEQIDIAEVFVRLRRAREAQVAKIPANERGPNVHGDLPWLLYCRTYERLWRLPAGSFVAADARAPARMAQLDADALLCARIVRAFATDPVRGGGRFASVLYRWIAEHEQELQHEREHARPPPQRRRKGSAGASGDSGDGGAGGSRQASGGFEAAGLFDTKHATLDRHGEPVDALPAAVLRSDALEDEQFDDLLAPGPERSGDVSGEGAGRPGQQSRETALRSPAEVAQLLGAMGLAAEQGAVIAKYYRTLAQPHLIPFPSRDTARAVSPQLEGLDPWEAGDSVDQLAVLQSLIRSPRLIPGVTTVQRHVAMVEGDEPGRRPMDLDLYIDCSGSMPDPRTQLSYLTLAGAVLALSALRAGGRVQVTLWSGRGQVLQTEGFERDPKTVLAMVCGFVSGGTRFPLEHLRDTYANREPGAPPAHIVVISDDGIDTLLGEAEGGGVGEDICRQALAKADGGGTLVLNMSEHYRQRWSPYDQLVDIGFDVQLVSAWPELVAFARAFARRRFGRGDAGSGRMR